MGQVMSARPIGVFSVTAGTRVRISTTRIPCQGFLVQAHPDNSAVGAVGGPAIVYATDTDILGWIGVPSSTKTVIPGLTSRHAYATGAFNMADFWLDCESGTQKFGVSIVE